MALFGLGGLGGMRQQQGNPQQGGGILGSDIPRLSSFLGMEGEDAQSAVRRQHFLNGFRTQVGQIPEFGEGVPEAAAQGFKMQQIKQENVQQDQERIQAADAKAKLAEFAMQKVHPSLRSLAESQPELALQMNEQMQPQQAQLTAEQRNWEYAQANPEFGAAYGIGVAQQPEAVVEAQTRAQLADQYGLTDQARQQFILTGDLPTARTAVPMSPTIQRELFETDDAILAGQSAIGSLDRALELSQTAYEGPFAEQRGYAGSLVGDKGGEDTILLRNEVTTQALNQLKAIFGAAPTEGERQILMDIQGAASQPRNVREAIYAKAKAMAETRLRANQQKAAGLRSGEYFGTGYGAGEGGVAVGTNGVPEGVDPADWEYMMPEERALWQQ